MTSDRTLRITIGEAHHQVEVSQEFLFGRDPGPGQLAIDDTTVSRVHGRITNLDDRWIVASTGSYLGFLIHDLDSAATLEVPAGVGQLSVPFRSAMVVVPARRRHLFTVTSPHNHESDDADGATPTTVAATERVVPQSACFDRDGRPLRWFQVLVALCEPRLTTERGGFLVPTDQEIRRRLGMGSSAFDRAFARARQELGFEPYTHLVRVAMATTAVHQGIVRPEHLVLLNADNER